MLRYPDVYRQIYSLKPLYLMAAKYGYMSAIAIRRWITNVCC